MLALKAPARARTTGTPRWHKYVYANAMGNKVKKIWNDNATCVRKLCQRAWRVTRFSITRSPWLSFFSTSTIICFLWDYSMLQQRKQWDIFDNGFMNWNI